MNFLLRGVIWLAAAALLVVTVGVVATISLPAVAILAMIFLAVKGIIL